MRIVVALGGNALLKRGEPLSAENQRNNASIAAFSLAKLIEAGHDLIVSHGNGPQVGLLALQGAAYDPSNAYPLDVLGAETEGMVGYIIEQELENALGSDKKVATLLTQVEVSASDPAFHNPSKPVGPIYTLVEAQALQNAKKWNIAPDGDVYRRVVPSPAPISIPDISVIKLLLDHDVTVICAGGGGIPVIRKLDGSLIGVEAVIDKDRSSDLLAQSLDAQMLLLLTDVDAVYADWGTTESHPIRSLTPNEIYQHHFASGSMAPKVEAACSFASNTEGIAAIGALEDALDIVNGNKGTRISR